MSTKTTEKITRLNLNDTVFFELNDVSLKLLAPTAEEQVRLIRDNVSEHTVDGQTVHLARMQLHDFIQKFSKLTGLGHPAPIKGNELFIIEKTTTVSGPIEPRPTCLKEPRETRTVFREIAEFLSIHHTKAGYQHWTSQNLNVDDGLPGITLDLVSGITYYTYEAALRIAQYAPDGWRLPSRDDWVELLKLASGKFPDTYPPETVLFPGAAPILRKSGHDSYGLAIKNSGVFLESLGFKGGNTASFWSSDPQSPDSAWYVHLDESDDVTLTTRPKKHRLPIRLVHD